MTPFSSDMLALQRKVEQIIMSNTHVYLVAYGQTAAARRACRVELWNRMDEFTFGSLDPAMAGRASAWMPPVMAR